MFATLKTKNASTILAAASLSVAALTSTGVAADTVCGPTDLCGFASFWGLSQESSTGVSFALGANNTNTFFADGAFFGTAGSFAISDIDLSTSGPFTLLNTGGFSFEVNNVFPVDGPLEVGAADLAGSGIVFSEEFDPTQFQFNYTSTANSVVYSLQIVAEGLPAERIQTSQVPLPASVWLFGTALASLVIGRRK